MNMGKVAHIPPLKKPEAPTGNGAFPKPPANQEYLTPAKVEAITPDEIQWIAQHCYLCYLGGKDLIDYEGEESMHMDSNKPSTDTSYE